MKKYIGLTIKRFLPFLIVGLILSFFCLSIVSANIVTSFSIYDADLTFLHVEIRTTVIGYIITAAVPMFLLTIIGPIFANSYRNSLESADLYYQFGKDKRYIRYVHNGVILGMILAILIVTYTSSLFMIILRQLPNLGRGPEYDQYGYATYFVVYNFFGIILLHLIYCVFAIINYSINYFLVTRSNNAVNSIILLILGNVILFVGIETPFLFSLFYTSQNNELSKQLLQIYNPIFLAPTKSASLVGVVGWLCYIFTDFIGGTPNTFLLLFEAMESEQIISLIISLIALSIYLGFATMSIITFFKEKESSGEHSGRAQGRDKWQFILFHIGFGLIGLWYGLAYLLFSLAGMIFITYFILTIGMTSFGAVYYVFTSILRRNFRLNKLNLFIILGSVLTNYISTIILIATITS